MGFKGRGVRGQGVVDVKGVSDGRWWGQWGMVG